MLLRRAATTLHTAEVALNQLERGGCRHLDDLTSPELVIDESSRDNVTSTVKVGVLIVAMHYWRAHGHDAANKDAITRLEAVMFLNFSFYLRIITTGGCVVLVYCLCLNFSHLRRHARWRKLKLRSSTIRTWRSSMLTELRLRSAFAGGGTQLPSGRNQHESYTSHVAAHSADEVF